MEIENEQKQAKSKSRKAPITIKLDTPVEWGDETIKTITLKPAKGKHLKHLPKDPALKDIMNLASKLSGVSSNVFDEMESDDVMKVAEAVGELL